MAPNGRGEKNMTMIMVEEAQARLSQLIDGLAPGEELVITRNARPIAQLVGLPAGKPLPVPGRGRGKLVIVSEDDDHLEDFEPYMT
jgi:antitoxin (DNA-binding transcriptional repressor) of toxin-antitoxin stability system